MSFTFLQEQGEESSAGNFSDIEPSALSRLNLTAGRFCCSDNATGLCPGSRSGMTCEHSTAGPGAESSMSSAADSHARTSAQPEKGQESTANAPDSGARWPGSLAKYDPDSRSWKTRQCSFLEGLAEFSETFPRWGSMHGGELFRQPTPVHRISEKEFGFWPTPRAADGPHGGNGPNSRDMSLTQAVKMWPTPTKSDGMGGPGNSGRDGGINLRTAVGGASRSRATATTTGSALFADSNTPRNASALAQQWTATNTPNETESCSPGLLPTPKSRDWKGQTQRGIHGPGDSIANLDRGDGKPIGGQLNPNWVEWLMGWPIGWTALKPLVTGKCQQWRRLHGGF